MNNPITRNREWIFSGIGVLAISLMLSLGVFVFRRATSVNTKQPSQEQVTGTSDTINSNSDGNIVSINEGQSVSGNSNHVGDANSQVNNDISQSVNGNNNQVIGNIDGTEGDVTITQNNSITQYRDKITIKGETPDASVLILAEPTDNPVNSISEVLTDLQNGKASGPKELITLLEGHNDRVMGDSFMVTSGTEVKILGDSQEALSDNGLLANGPTSEAKAFEKVLSGLTVTHVEILSGPHKGKSGWVISYLIQTEQVPVTSN